MLPRPTAKYAGFGPLTLAVLTYQFEGEDDIEFLAVQDAVSALTDVEKRIFREQYIRIVRERS